MCLGPECVYGNTDVIGGSFFDNRLAIGRARQEHRWKTETSASQPACRLTFSSKPPGRHDASFDWCAWFSRKSIMRRPFSIFMTAILSVFSPEHKKTGRILHP